MLGKLWDRWEFVLLDEMTMPRDQRLATHQKVRRAVSEFVKSIFMITGWTVLIAAISFLADQSGHWALHTVKFVLIALLLAYILYNVLYVVALLFIAGDEAKDAKRKNRLLVLATIVWAIGIFGGWGFVGTVVDALVALKQ